MGAGRGVGRWKKDYKTLSARWRGQGLESFSFRRKVNSWKERTGLRRWRSLHSLIFIRGFTRNYRAGATKCKANSVRRE